MRREFFCFKTIRYKKRGSISVLVLWAVSITALLSVGIGYRSYTELRSLRYFKDRFNSRYLVLSGLNKGCDILREDYKSSPGYDNPLEVWAESGAIFENEYGSCRVKISDQDRKVDLNYFAKNAKDDSRSLNVLISFLAEELAYSLIDWVDSDGIVSGNLGAESDGYYKFLNYSSRDSELETLQELKYIKGCSDYLDIGEISKNLTIGTADIKMNINTVEPKLLYRLGLSDDLAGKILDYRSEGNYFKNLPANIADIFPEFREGAVEEEWEDVKKYFKVSSQYFKMLIEAETTRGLHRYAQALVKRDGHNFKVIHFWDNLDGNNI